MPITRAVPSAQPIAQFIAELGEASEEEFLEKYRFPFLLRETTEASEPPALWASCNWSGVTTWASTNA